MGNFNKYNVIEEDLAKQPATPAPDYEERAKGYLYKNGKMMVYFFTIVNLVLYVFALPVGFSIVGLIIQIIVALLLFGGVRFAKIPVMLNALINILIGMLIINVVAGMQSNVIVKIIMDTFYILIIVYLIYSTVMLCFSKSVNEYFKVRKHLSDKYRKKG